ncbi:hypothetical protein BH20ACT5_BH20ACT5_01230 [soil metagenome]
MWIRTVSVSNEHPIAVNSASRVNEQAGRVTGFELRADPGGFADQMAGLLDLDAARLR